MTSAASVSPRLISAVSPEPAGLLAAAAAELARRWASGNYDLDAVDALADLSCIRDALQSLTGLFKEQADVSSGSLFDVACELAEDQMVSCHADKRTVQAGVALDRAASELGQALDRSDLGFGW